MGAALKPSTGWILDGRYELEKEIGQGGMATVWRARHLVLDKPVAVKFLRRSQDEVLRRRFLREARVAAAIRHRHVVNVMDAGTQDKWVYMVMELLEGDTLDERLECGQMDLSNVVRTMAQLLGGLNAVHDAGMIHRDIKPANVMLVDDGDGVFPKLLDFGISKSALIPAESGEHRLASVIPTEENMIVGTPEYMSPEQVRGDRGLSASADVYSMGALMYELLSGARPFVFKSQTTAAMLIIVATQKPRPLADYRPELPPSILEFVAKAMDRDPQARFPNAAAMRRGLIMAAGQAAERLLEKAPKAAKKLRQAIGAAYEPGDSAVIYLDTTLPPVPAPAAERAAAVTLESDPPPPTKRVVPWVPAGLVVVGLLVGGAFAFGGADDAAESEPVRAEPTPEERLVTFSFRGVPADGLITVNGNVVEGDSVQVGQSHREHSLRVTAPGRLPFEEMLSANADAVVVVSLTQEPEVVPEAPPEEPVVPVARMTSMTAMSTRMTRMVEPAMVEAPPEEEPQMTHFRDPGF